MFKTILSTILFFTLSFSLTAQDYTVINHNYENFHDFPNDIFFAEDANNDIWVLQQGGFTGVVISRFSNGSWENIPFDACSNCSYNIASDINGVIYLSTNVGFYAYENNNWVSRSGDIIARSDFAFDAQNNLWFRHDDGTAVNLAYMNPSGAVTVIAEVEGDIENLTIANDGKIWFRNNMQIVSYDGAMVERFDLNMNHIDVTGDNKVWFTDFSGGVGVLDNGNSMEDIYTDVSVGFAHTSMATDRDNNFMWLGVQGVNAGIGWLNLNNGDYNFIDAEEIYVDAIGLSNATFVSSTGSLWVAARFDPQVAEIVPEIIMGTQDVLQTISLYPNPTTGKIKLELEASNLNGAMSFTIYNHLGQLVDKNLLEHDGEGYSLDVSGLNNGWYTLRSLELGLQSVFIKI